MSAGINMIWAPLKHILAQAVWRGLKLALRRALNVFIPKNINCVTISIILEGTNGKLETRRYSKQM